MSNRSHLWPLELEGGYSSPDLRDGKRKANVHVNYHVVEDVAVGTEDVVNSETSETDQSRM